MANTFAGKTAADVERSTTARAKKHAALIKRAETDPDSLTESERTLLEGVRDVEAQGELRLRELSVRTAYETRTEEQIRVENDALRFAHETVGNADTRAFEEEGGIGAQLRNAIRTRSNEPLTFTAPRREMRSGYQPGIERRTLVTSSGGGLIRTSFWNQLVMSMVESSAILAAGATIISSETGEDLVVPRVSALSTASIVAENTVIPTSDPTFGRLTLNAYKYGFMLQVSHELANDAGFDLEGFISTQVGMAIGNGFGVHAITGDGTGKPTGILTGATVGITGPTGTSTSFGNQSTAGQGGDLLIDLAASLAEPYQRSKAAAWLMRGTTLAAIKKLKTSQGDYVFNSDVIPGSGSAGTILGKPVYIDPNMPAIAPNATSVLFGDISRYWVRQVASIRLDRSEHVGFDRDLITYRGLARIDGALIDPNAVKTFKHSAT
ncbi:phage major capsid protein [Microbacterium sp.]|uniref:phage major capsid protein n=1 Tax=Microbacterium sp. TaxID=51671 RepID=UPI0039E36F7B